MQHKRELKSVRRGFSLGEFDLYYFDEAGFSLVPSVPYGWQPTGQRIEIPSGRSPQLNVLGFLRHDGKHFDSYVAQGSVDGSMAIACIDHFCSKLRKPTTVVIDNAPVHTSAMFQSMIPEWESRNLFFWFLPPYCPELNLIEILWKKIKYQWLPIDAYESFEKLNDKLCSILANIGKLFSINFTI